MLLAVVFAWAAVSKLRDGLTTTADFTSLGLPRPHLLARVVPLVEIGVAGLLLVVPGWGGVAGFTLLVMFTVILIAVLRNGTVASCACFGGSSSQPVGWRHLARNGLLVVLALVAATVNQSSLALLDQL